MLPIRYSGGALDRAAKLREDDDWMSSAFVSDATVALLVHNDQNLVSGLASREERPCAVRVPFSLVRETVTSSGAPWLFVGLDGEVPVFAVELSAASVAEIPHLRDAGEFADLRTVGSLVSANDAALMSYARAMLLWQRRHGFCSICGSRAEIRRGGHVRRCTNPECAAESFPRTDPVVIMLVTRPATADYPERALLGRHSRLPRGAYSLLAGFVEPGESLEDAVAREVWEEAGVRVSDVRYVASQPWPFPYSMMIGFRATADADEISIDRDELEDARWFTADEIARFGEWGDETAEFRRPRKDAIARAILDDWIGSNW